MWDDWCERMDLVAAEDRGNVLPRSYKEVKTAKRPKEEELERAMEAQRAAEAADRPTGFPPLLSSPSHGIGRSNLADPNPHGVLSASALGVTTDPPGDASASSHLSPKDLPLLSSPSHGISRSNYPKAAPESDVEQWYTSCVPARSPTRHSTRHSATSLAGL